MQNRNVFVGFFGIQIHSIEFNSNLILMVHFSNAVIRLQILNSEFNFVMYIRSKVVDIFISLLVVNVTTVILQNNFGLNNKVNFHVLLSKQQITISEILRFFSLLKL